MKAKDKAEELIEKFGIEKSILCVDEMINFSLPLKCTLDEDIFLQEVKQEILNRQ